MVFEGELDSACSETRSSYTESELENIKAKNLEVDRNLNFVPVPQSPSLTAFIENQLSKSENFSEQEMDSLLQQNLKLDTKLGSDSESLEITVKVEMFAGWIFSRVKTSRTHIFAEKNSAKIKTICRTRSYGPREKMASKSKKLSREFSQDNISF